MSKAEIRELELRAVKKMLELGAGAIFETTSVGVEQDSSNASPTGNQG